MNTTPPFFHRSEMMAIVDELGDVIRGRAPAAVFAALGFCMSDTIRQVSQTDQDEARNMAGFALDLLRKHLDKYAPPPPQPPAQ